MSALLTSVHQLLVLALLLSSAAGAPGGDQSKMDPVDELVEEDEFSDQGDEFKHYDMDSNGVLEGKEADNLMTDLGLPLSHLAKIDEDGDGSVSHGEYEHAQSAGLLEEQEQGSDEEGEEDGEDGGGVEFTTFDIDHSGFLEEGEIKKLMKTVGLKTWKEFDTDKDGKLSKEEFIHGQSSAGASLMQEDGEEEGEGGEEGEESEEDQDMGEDEMEGGSSGQEEMSFSRYDVDESGHLEPEEAQSLMEDVGLDSNHWVTFDTDKDGKMSEAEFKAGASNSQGAESDGEGGEEQNFEEEDDDDDAKSLLEEDDFEEEEAHFGDEDEEFESESSDQQPALPAEVQDDHGIFFHLDADKSGFLEQTEVASLLALSPGLQNVQLQDFDHDKDGKWSKDEYLEAGTAAASEVRVRSGQENTSENVAEEKKIGEVLGYGLDTEKHVFAQSDSDGSSFLEHGEIKNLIERAGIDNAEEQMKSFDADKDGKWSFDEFLHAGKVFAPPGDTHEKLENEAA